MIDQRLHDVLNGKEANYILPFYWQYGDHTNLIPQQIKEIFDSGCRGLCIESKSHPDFIGKGWWKDMDVIFAEAEKLGMRVWILDDDKFPTGHAAGMISKKYPSLRRWELVEHHIDVVGPETDIQILTQEESEEYILIGAYAYQRNTDTLESCSYESIDITPFVYQNRLTWNIPEGVWRIFFYYRSQKGNMGDYIDTINAESVRVLIDTVYESHWKHYKRYFGNTLAGFFSDEPFLGGKKYGQSRFDFGFYEARIGTPSLSLPWNENVLKGMQERLGFDPVPHLNLLWYEDGENGDKQAEIRYSYMDTVTALYSECFNKQLADWCHAHNVQYVGHIIEDNNSHCHMSYSPGHYFRSMRWQDMSGIDVVFQQVLNGMSDHLHTSGTATHVANGPFFHYVLAKLGASLAHLTPAMQGRALCELFGAFGWGEDSSKMKYLADHLLVRGINHFVPHAVSPHYPNAEFPPHLGKQGNPSFEAFGALMCYINRAAHLLSGGIHKANAAILYHAYGEWASRLYNASTMDDIAQRLYDAHIDYDIVSMDILAEAATIKDNKLFIGKENFECLIVPYADHIPQVLSNLLNELKNQGLPVWFINKIPENLTFQGTSISLNTLVTQMRMLGMTDVTLSDEFPKLRIYHCVRGENDIFMFFNEDFSKVAKTTVQLPCKGAFARLDILNEIYTSGVCEDGNLELNLLPNHSQIVIFGDRAELPPDLVRTRIVSLSPSYTLELANCDKMTEFVTVGQFDHFFNINARDFRPDFSGKMRYSFSFQCQSTNDRILLDLGRVGQNAELWINNTYCGIRIATPYVFDVTNAIQLGENNVTVLVSNTPAQQQRDYYSHFLQLSPSGLLGDIHLIYAKIKNH